MQYGIYKSNYGRRKERVMRLIDADNLLKIFDERLKVYEGEDGTKERYAYMAWLRSRHAIEDAPTIAIKASAILLPPHAEWIEPTSYDGLSAGYYICSKCRCIYGQASNYCPNCGAKMDGERSEG